MLLMLQPNTHSVIAAFHMGAAANFVDFVPTLRNTENIHAKVKSSSMSQLHSAPIRHSEEAESGAACDCLYSVWSCLLNVCVCVLSSPVRVSVCSVSRHEVVRSPCMRNVRELVKFWLFV